MPVEAVLLLELGFDVRSVSDMIPTGGCGCGERGGRGGCDICDAECDEAGKDESKVLFGATGAIGAATPARSSGYLVALVPLESTGNAVWGDPIFRSTPFLSNTQSTQTAECVRLSS